MMVPKGWEVTALENVLTIKYGKDQKEVESIDGKYPILGTGGIIGYTNSFLCNQPSVLIGRKGTINSPMYMDTPFWTVDTLFYSHIKKNNDSKWAFYIFQSINWTKYNEASGVPSLSAGNINRVKIKRPSFPEQQKIATILSTLDSTIEATQKLIDKEKMVKKGLMADLLTHGIDEQGRIRSPQTHMYVDSPLGMIPEGWEVLRLSDIGQVITGNTPSTEHEEYYGGIIPFIGPVDFRGQKYIDEAEKNVSELGLLQSRKIPINTIMTVCIGSTIGKIAIVVKDSCTNQQINSLVCTNQFNSEYIFYAMSQYLKKQLDIEAGLQAVPIVNKSSFSKLLLPCPMQTIEQQKIAAILSAQDRKIETEETNLAKLQNLKKGLMGDLLSGKVRVKG
jgi:type I restriction enzyme, S subunit